ncbi:MAG: HAD hydrolase-like protein [Pseudomonadota bacterium]
MIDLSKNKEALLQLPKPKAVIFDWDNTLVDTWPLIHEAIDKTMVAMGHKPWGLEKVRDTVHKSMRESFPIIFGDDWEKAGEIYKHSYRSIHLDKIELLSNAMNLVNKLEEQGILQILVSNKIGITLRKEAVKLGIDRKFFSIIGASDASFDKPNREPVDLALLGSGLDPKKDVIWFVGDTIADVECAYNSGCVPVVYGHSGNQISKTISLEMLQEKNLPIYFDHQELVELL